MLSFEWSIFGLLSLFILLFWVFSFQVCDQVYWAGWPELFAELPEEHGLWDLGEPHPHIRYRVYQGSDEQLPGTGSRPGPSRKYQHHIPELTDWEHQDQDCRAGDPRGCLLGTRWSQESLASHASLPSLCCRKDKVPGKKRILWQKYPESGISARSDFTVHILQTC